MKKPPLPAHWFDTWPRIPVDPADGTDVARIIRLGVGAADDWALGPDGIYKQPNQSMAEIIRAIVRESLVHLLELGLIDIDAERMHAANGVPMRRTDCRNDEEPKP